MAEALAVLGCTPGTPPTEVRHAYRRLLLEHHPDLAGGSAEATARTALLAEAWAVLRDAGTSTPSPPDHSPAPAAEGGVASVHWVEATSRTGHDSATITVHAPPDVAFRALFEAAGTVGQISYVDRHLGLIETIVRFVGGPSCSVLVTTCDKSELTEALVTIESIEAAPTPPIGPVLTALAEALAARRS